MKTKLRAVCAIEFALCVLIGWALTHTVHGGFNIDDALESNFLLMVVVCGVAQVLLFSSAYKPDRRVLCHVIYIVLALVACVVAVMISPNRNPVDDIPQNYFIAILCIVVVNLLVFELSRKHATCVILFGLGALLCGLIQFLYTTNMLATTVIFLVASLMLIFLRSYMDTIEDLAVDTPPLLGKATAVGVLFPATALAIAAAVVIGVIMPLNPPHAVIKLQTLYLAYEEQQVKTGVALDDDAAATHTSANVDESLPSRTTTDKKVDVNSEERQNDTSNSSQDSKDYLSDDYSDVDFSGALEGLSTLALYPPVPWPVIIATVIGLLIALLLFPRYVVHRLRLRRIAAMPAVEQVGALYRFFLSRFKKLGFEKPENLTPIEYANLYRERLCPYVGAQEACTFDHLTSLYVWRGYGNQQPSQGDLECMYYLYDSFYAKARKKLGLIKYLFRHPTL